MKRINIFLVAASFTISMFAQPPNKISYQAIVRDAGNNLVKNQTIGMQISILHGSVTGVVAYTEIQTPTTNENGLLSIEIGVNAGFESIDWANGPFYIKTEIDPTGGNNYTIIGTSQILSVPYALHARTAEEVTGAITETDPLYTSSQAANLTATDITNLGNLSGVNTGDQDISGLATIAALGDSTAQVRSNIPDVSGFLISETDPVYSSSVAAGITGTDTTNWNNKLDSYTETDPVYGSSIASEITETDTTNWNNKQEKLTAGTGISIIGNTISANSGGATYSVGDYAQGGVVFWVDETGQHGLACAIEDQSIGVRWYAGTYGNTRACGDGPFAGEANTSIIIAAHVAIGDDGSTYAARICNELQVTQGDKTYGDWYLPSKYELNLIYDNKATINTTATANGGSSFVSAHYWSSTEYGSNYYAWEQDFYDGEQSGNDKYDNDYVRAVRAF